MIPRIAILTAVVVALLAPSARAQGVQIIHDFGPVFSSLSVPTSLMQATDGNFYGSAIFSGRPEGGGAIFKMTPQGVITLTWADVGSAPILETRDGELYAAGVFGVRKLRSDGTLDVVYEFDFATEGNPRGGLVEAADGHLYGTTFDGGESGDGAVFRLTRAGALTWLHAFDGDDGAGPATALIQATDGRFYGTTLEGGSNGLGTLFRMMPDGTLTVVHHFSGIDGDGATPQGALVQGLDGNIYGTTAAGGEHGHGTVFRVTAAGGVSVVYAFTGGVDGSGPSGLIRITDGRLCGTTDLKIYCVTSAGAFTLLHTMNPAVEGFSTPGLVHGFDGYFYGAGNSFITGGTVFRLRHPSPCDDAVTLLHRDNTLEIFVTLRSETPAFSGAWLVFNSTVVPLWATTIPAVTPAVGVYIPIPEFPNVGNVGVLTWLVTQTNAVCADWKTLDTGSAASGQSLFK